MQEALYAPGIGYYTGGLLKFGKEGDFVTAPELSPLFANTLANQCEQVLQVLSTDNDSNTLPTTILEFGAGTGKLAANLLRALEAKDCLPAHYVIIELSAELQSRQAATIKAIGPQLAERVSWRNTLPTEPINGVIIGNEVLDAMPVTLFKQDSQALKEATVTVSTDSSLLLDWRTATPQLTQAIESLGIDFQPGYTSEINHLIAPWINSLSTCLHQGVCLLIDYGFPAHEYYHPQRHMGTLMCHFQHHAHSNPLILTGIQDITAHVDFTLVANAAVDAGFQVTGFTNQAAFLLNCGLLEQANESHAREIKQLTLPTEMGELFKVMALTKEWDAPLLGFSQHDQRVRL